MQWKSPQHQSVSELAEPELSLPFAHSIGAAARVSLSLVQLDRWTAGARKTPRCGIIASGRILSMAGQLT
jgi:hypothetical protein